VRWLPLVVLAACGKGVIIPEEGDDTAVRPDDTDDPDPDDVDPDACTPASVLTKSVVVTDIDETLTTADSEFLRELADSSYDPAMRPDADRLMTAWRDRGYRILYVTARGSSLSLLDGRSATDATTDWLTDHGFPFEDGDVFLADGWGEFGSAAADYKTGVLETIAAEGLVLAYAYGNADTDVEAYKNAGIPDDKDFLVGKLAGDFGVVGVSDADAYTTHLETWPAAAPCGE
jgi:phosphatidate phosphatase PAH1